MTALGPVEIGAREIYDEVRGVRADVQDLRADARGHTADLADHESRLRVLEQSRWPVPALAVLVSIAAVIVAWVRG